jgi:excisionase family DNA binding protein
MTEAQKHLTMGAAARLLGVSRWWVWRRVRSGEIDAVRLTGSAQYMVLRAALEPLLHHLHHLHHNHP